MKKILFLFSSLFASLLHACPTCVGKVTATTVPFFDQDFYKPHKQTVPPHNSAIEYGKKELQKLIDEHKGKK